MQSKIECNICSAGEFNSSFIGGYELLTCLSCGITRSAELPSEEELSLYYSKEYKISEDLYVDTEKRRLARITEQVSLIKLLSKYIPESGSILDIGCDKGFFIDEARRCGYKSCGVEPSENARRYCENIGLNVISSLDNVDEKFDAAVFWHSLEHHSDPKKTLTDLKKNLKDGSYVFIRVPAYDSFWSKLLKDKWIWFQPHNHYYHFSLNSMRILLELTGYNVVEIEHRKPNNRVTKKMFSVAGGLFKREYRESYSMKKRLGRIYQDLTGIEIFAVARFGNK